MAKKPISQCSAAECWGEVSRLLCELGAAEPVMRNALPKTWRGRSGVYVFYKGAEAIYVGRGRNLYNRVQQHARLSVKDAPLAVLMAKAKCNITTSYMKGKGRSSWVNSPDYLKALEEFKKEVAQMTIKGVVVPDDHNGLISCMLEVAVAIETKATLNQFHTS